MRAWIARLTKLGRSVARAGALSISNAAYSCARGYPLLMKARYTSLPQRRRVEATASEHLAEGEKQKYVENVRIRGS